MSNETIPAIPVLATQINDSDLFEKADGLAGGQSQRVPASLFKSYLANAAQIISTADLNPNTAGIIPAAPTAGAIWYQIPSAGTGTNQWTWDINLTVWRQTSA
jgi:hypothetical protein